MMSENGTRDAWSTPHDRSKPPGPLNPTIGESFEQIDKTLGPALDATNAVKFHAARELMKAPDFAFKVGFNHGFRAAITWLQERDAEARRAGVG